MKENYIPIRVHNTETLNDKLHTWGVQVLMLSISTVSIYLNLHKSKFQLLYTILYSSIFILIQLTNYFFFKNFFLSNSDFISWRLYNNWFAKKIAWDKIQSIEVKFLKLKFHLTNSKTKTLNMSYLTDSEEDTILKLLKENCLERNIKFTQD